VVPSPEAKEILLLLCSSEHLNQSTGARIEYIRVIRSVGARVGVRGGPTERMTISYMPSEVRRVDANGSHNYFCIRIAELDPLFPEDVTTGVRSSERHAVEMHTSGGFR